MYPSEFPVEETAGYDPTLLLLSLLLGGALLAVAWFLGRGTGRREGDAGRRAACKSIHEAIQRRCKAATGATEDMVVAEARRLRDELQARLGHVLALGGALSDRTRPLFELLDPPPAPAPERRRDGAAAHEEPAADHGEAGHESAQPHGVHINTPGPVFVSPTPPPPARPPHRPEPPRPPTPAEHVQAVRQAVHRVSDWWNSEACLRELRAAQRQLCETAPVPKSPATH